MAQPFRQSCRKCGARRIDAQIGLEATPEEYVAALVAVFREARRVLRDDGTLWLNIGDSYAGGKLGNTNGGASSGLKRDGRSERSRQRANEAFQADMASMSFRKPVPSGAKAKDLLMIPARLAFALQAGFARCDGCGLELRCDLWPVWNGHRVCLDCERAGRVGTRVIPSEPGWYLRAECIWAKPNPMPESVDDRPTNAHEKVFMLAKRPKYFYDHEAVKEPNAEPIGHGGWQARQRAILRSGKPRNFHADYARTKIPAERNDSDMNERYAYGAGRNLRNVWTITLEPSGLKHFAIMPTALAEICIKAGTSEKGCCPHCGAGWVRNSEVIGKEAAGHGWGANATVHPDRNEGAVEGLQRKVKVFNGWQPSCDCPEHKPVPATVLDFFGGVGTTGLVADRLGRSAVLIELHPGNINTAADRVRQDAGLFAEVSHL